MKTGTKIGWLLLAISIMFSIWVIISQQNRAASHVDANGFEVDENGILIAYPVGSDNVTVPSTIDGITVTGLKENLFNGDTTVSTIVLADSVTDLGTGFTGCTGLLGVYIGSGVSELRADMFMGDSSLTYISVDGNNSYYTSVGGCVYNAAGNNLLIVPPGNTLSLAEGMDAAVVPAVTPTTEDMGVTTAPEEAVEGAIPGNAAGIVSEAAGTATITLSNDLGDKSYKIYRSNSADGEFKPVVKTAKGSTAYTDSGLNSGTQYYYIVKEVYVSNGQLQYGEESAPTAVTIM